MCAASLASVNPAALGAIGGLESSARLKGSDNAYGWNAGVLFNLDGDSRVGLHYRSSLKYRIDGTATFVNPAVPAAAGGLAAAVNASVLSNGRVTSDVKIPAIAPACGDSTGNVSAHWYRANRQGLIDGKFRRFQW